MPAISVVIPVYNAAPFLREAMDSLLAQTCGDFEAIAVNDGSTDNSLEILQEYAARDSRIRILDGPNGGYGKAMNRGMDAATGKYMAILEPDDYLPREAYDVLLPQAEQHQLDVVRGTHCCFYEEGNQRKYGYVIRVVGQSEVICPRKMGNKGFAHPPAIWSSLYRLSFLRDNGIRFHESPGASYQDTGFVFQALAFAERCQEIDEPVYMYRTDNPNSSVNNLGKKKWMLLYEYQRLRENLEASPSIWESVKKQYYAHMVEGVVWVISQLTVSEGNELLPMFRGMLNDADCEYVLPIYAPYLTIARNGGELSDELLKRFESPPEVTPAVVRTRSFLGVPVYRVEMAPEFTRRKLFGITIQSRYLRGVYTAFSSGIKVSMARRNDYYVMGVKVCSRRINESYGLHRADMQPAVVETGNRGLCVRKGGM